MLITTFSGTSSAAPSCVDDAITDVIEAALMLIDEAHVAKGEPSILASSPREGGAPTLAVDNEKAPSRSAVRLVKLPKFYSGVGRLFGSKLLACDSLANSAWAAEQITEDADVLHDPYQRAA